MSISPLTPSMGFGVTPGFGINPAYGVSATPPRTQVDLGEASTGAATFGQMLAQRIEAFGPAASAAQTAMAPAAAVNASASSTPVTAPGAGFGPSAPAPDAATSPTAVNTTTGATANRFGDMITSGLGQLNALHQRSDALATAAATGDLKDIHEYTIAANEAGVATQLAVNVRDKALQSFNDIIRMQL